MEEDLREAWAGMESPGPHPDIRAYLRDGDEAREVMESHLAACRRCRTLLAELQRPSVRLRRWVPLGAAAALLLGVFAWRFSAPPAVQPAASTVPALPAVSVDLPASLPSPGGLWKAEEGDVEAVAGEGILLTLKRGSRLRAGEAIREFILEEGGLLAESPGERLLLRLGTVTAEMEEGVLAAEIQPAPAPLAWLRSAEASEGVRVTMIKGSARLSGDGEARTLKAGESLGEPLSWPAPSWQPLSEGIVVVGDGERRFLEEAPAAYVFEALVRKRRASTETGVIFAAGGRAWQAPAGENLLPVRPGWTRVRVSVDRARCRVTVGSRELVDRAPADLGRKVLPAEGRGAGLKAWGGDLEVKEARWRVP